MPLFRSLVALAALLSGSAALAQTTVFINEIHYDNVGSDVGEAIEVAGPAGTDLSGWTLVLYNGNGGTAYNSINLPASIVDDGSGYGTVFIDLPTNGLQNGSPDGIALVDGGGSVIQFLSYEGGFTAVGGPADGMSSTDIGISESSGTAIGDSLQLAGTGCAYEDFSWTAAVSTFGAVNNGQIFDTTACVATDPALPFVNELHYDNVGSDVGEAIEVAGAAGTDLNGWSLVLYNGNGGSAYNTLVLTGAIVDDGSGYGTVFVDLPTNGLQNGAPDGLALVDGVGNVVQFLSYEGSFTAVGGPANGMSSTDIGISESSATPVSFSLQLVGSGCRAEDFSWAPAEATFGAVNRNQTFDTTNCGSAPPPPPPGPTGELIINEFLADPAADLTGDANGDGTRNGSEDEFIELVNSTGSDLDISDWTISDAVGLRHTFPAGTTVAANCAVVVFGGGTPTGDFGGSLVQLSSNGFLGFNNGGDAITVANASGVEVASVSYGSEGGTDQSLTRDPDLSGDFIGHSMAATAAGALFSPGGNADGSPFDAACDAGGPSGPELSLIGEVQGSGDSTPLNGQTVVVEAIVTGDFQDSVGDNGDLNGFFIQDDGDGNDATSDGVFVFQGSNPSVDVQRGDRVRVTGVAEEFFGETQIDVLSGSVEILSSGNPVTPVAISLPAAATRLNSQGNLIPDFERYEGMLVQFAQTLYVTELFNLDRFGEMRLSSGDRLFQFTQQNAPDVAGFAAHLEAVGANNVFLDDGFTFQNPDPIPYPAPGLSTDNAVRMGDTVANLTGNLRYSRGSGGSGDEAYRIQPVETPMFVNDNVRPAGPPMVGGRLSIASFNVLNFFNDLDDPTGACFPSLTDDDCRGADNAFEFERQLEKLVTTIAALDADVIGISEIENDSVEGELSSLSTLVNAVNDSGLASCSTYDWVDAGERVGADAIAVAIIYCSDSLRIADGTSVEILDDSDLNAIGRGGQQIFDGFATNRAVLAATFSEIDSGEKFTVAANHFKSKGQSGIEPCDAALDGNCDANDGAGYWNARRTDAANALAEWLATGPTGSDDPDIVILGDLNAYLEEDPIAALEAAGYVNLVRQVPNAYSFVFNAQAGTLDYALVSASMADSVTGVGEWHINADEADGLDYNTDFGRPTDVFDGSQVFRNSDHDPLLFGTSLSDTQPPAIACNAPATISSSERGISFTATADDAIDSEPYVGIDSVKCERVFGKFTFPFAFCRVSVDGDTITINNPGGSRNRISWKVSANDASGNASEESCSVDAAGGRPLR